jgi:probable rRNA maturation factor
MPKVEARVSPRVKGVTPRWAAGIVAGTLKAERASKHSVGILVTDNAEIRKINKQFLKHDYATDMISFNLGDGQLGDVVVSAQMAAQTAKELGIPYKEELARYLVHGTLHLLGYRDKKKSDHKRMHVRQEKILERVV